MPPSADIQTVILIRLLIFFGVLFLSALMLRLAGWMIAKSPPAYSLTIVITLTAMVINIALSVVVHNSDLGESEALAVKIFGGLVSVTITALLSGKLMRDRDRYSIGLGKGFLVALIHMGLVFVAAILFAGVIFLVIGN